MDVRTLLTGLLLAFLLPGCTSPASPAADATTVAPAPSVGQPHWFAGDFNLTATGVKACTPVVDPEAFREVNWVAVIVDHAANDSHVAVRFDWASVNPTSESIRFRVRDGPGTFDAKILDQWDGVSYQVRDFAADELATLPDPFYVEASLTGCPPEGLVGVHANEKDLMEQPVHFQIAWNGAAFQ